MQACETSPAPQRSNEHKQEPNNHWISINQLANHLSISICSCTNPNWPSWCVSLTLKKRPNGVAPTVPSLNDSPHNDTIPSSLSRGAFDLSPKRTNHGRHTSRNKTFSSSIRPCMSCSLIQQRNATRRRKRRRKTSGGPCHLFMCLTLGAI